MGKKVKGRHGARWAALQGLYAWQLTGSPLTQIEADLCEKHFQNETEATTFDKVYLQELLGQITLNAGSLDELILPFLDRSLNEVHLVERGILWIAFYELTTRFEIPYKVIINEAIEIAKLFGAQDSHKFINGVLDKAAKKLRVTECQI